MEPLPQKRDRGSGIGSKKPETMMAITLKNQISKIKIPSSCKYLGFVKLEFICHLKFGICFFVRKMSQIYKRLLRNLLHFTHGCWILLLLLSPIYFIKKRIHGQTIYFAVFINTCVFFSFASFAFAK
jgi:hypothetical protein